MASPDYRSTHIPLTIVRNGPVIEIIPNRARSIFNLENNDLRERIQTYSKYIIQEFEEFSAPSIAFNQYNNHQYWWVLCLYNGILDPTSELYAGRELLIPNQSEVQAYLSRSLNNIVSRFIPV